MARVKQYDGPKPGYDPAYAGRNHVARGEVRDIMAEIQANLDTSRMSPERLDDLMTRLYALMDCNDDRARERAIKQVIELYKWQTEYEAPKSQKIEHEFPSSIEIRVVSHEDGTKTVRMPYKGE